MTTRRPWLLTSILFGVGAAVLTALLLRITSAYWLTVALVGLAVFLFALFHNPASRYRRLATATLFTWLTSRALPTITFEAQASDNFIARFITEDLGAAYDIAAVAVTMLLLVLDFLSTADSGILHRLLPNPPVQSLPRESPTSTRPDRRYRLRLRQRHGEHPAND